MKKVALVGFGFMGLTHTINILKNSRLQLVAIVDKNIENIEKSLSNQAGNFSTGSISKESLSGIRMYSTLDDCILHEQTDGTHASALNADVPLMGNRSLVVDARLQTSSKC